MKSYHWIQHVSAAILRAPWRCDMNRTNSLLILSALAATAANAEPPLRPYEGDLMIPTLASTRLATLSRALEVIEFWEDAGPALWFAKDPEFDRRFRDRFLADHEAAVVILNRTGHDLGRRSAALSRWRVRRGDLRHGP